MPQHPGGRLQLMSCLRAAGRYDEAELAGQTAMQHFPTSHDIFAGWARLTDANRDWPEALVRWTKVFDRFPDHAGAFIGVVSALRELRQFDRAEAIFLGHGSRFPSNAGVAAAAAWLAMSSKNWPLAEARWRTLRDNWPDLRNGYVGGASALRELGRFDEAEALLLEAVDRFGRLPELLIIRAGTTEARKDWENAYRHWQDASSVTPDTPVVILGQVRVLLRAGRSTEADALLASLGDRFPESADVALMQGVRAEERKEWPAALAFWTKAALLDPARAFFAARMADVLMRLNRKEEAEGIVGEALSRQPSCVDLLGSWAALAQARCEWDEAKKRWQKLLEIAPSNDAAIFQLGIVNYHLTGVDADNTSEIRPLQAATKAVAVSAERRNAGEISTLEMFMQMESLGDNCEFGLVQRKFGAEPLGLLRWTAMNLEKLAEALDNNLEGVGLPENTCLELRDDEYHTSDTRYFMRMHTFIHANQENDPDRLLVTLCKRLQYLRRELLGNLRDGHQSLYVYKSVLGYKSGAVDRLCRSLQRFGSNTLLCVKLADQDHREGTARMIDPTLIVGYISHFAPEGGWPNTAFASWEKMCRQAFHLWRGIVATSAIKQVT